MSDDSEKKNGPGPAHYFLPSTVGHKNHDISKCRSPSFSMGVRLPGLFCEQNVQSPSPGPKYQVEYLTKYGKANLASSISSLRAGRTRSCVGPDLGNQSANVIDASDAYSRKYNAANMNGQSNLPDYNLYERRNNLKVGDSRTIRMNNGMSSFCREFGDNTNITKPGISSARRQIGNLSRYKTDVRHPKY